jgi:hypothetical protein
MARSNWQKSLRRLLVLETVMGRRRQRVPKRSRER